jgi:hypothetical protein
MNLVAMGIAESRRETKMTILHRPDGVWHVSEVGRLINCLTIAASEHPQYPEYLIVFGHYTKEETLQALGGGVAYTATQITGMDHRDLPFVPNFA